MHGEVGRVALLFGSEKTGLSNEEMSHCNWLLTVPMQKYEGIRHPSMNLGQAVAVCLYELAREEWKADAAQPIALRKSNQEDQTGATEPATAADLERLAALLSEVLEETEYQRHHAGNCGPEQVRRLVRRAGLNATDAPVWMGILRQVLWKLGPTSHRS
jgi:tRNA C32,U32 (ribose-2'-O)-methylase TrmJ